jgi:hypothetical protein
MNPCFLYIGDFNLPKKLRLKMNKMNKNRLSLFSVSITSFIK